MSSSASSPPDSGDTPAEPVVTILVALNSQGSDVWKTTTGRRIRGNLYELLPTPGYDQTREDWEFPAGTIVECFRSTRRDGSPFLVAVRAVTP